MSFDRTQNRDVLDTALHTETPEGIFIELRPAGLPVRGYAWAIDWLIRMVVISILSALLRPLGGVGAGIALACFFLLEWLYPVAFELSRWGATPGKKTMNLKTVMDNGLPITPAASLTRNLLRVVDFMPMMFGFGIVCMLWRGDFKRIGDVVAATLVVHVPKPTTATLDLGDVPPLAPMHPLTLEQQATLLSLAARSRTLTPARMDELALLAAPTLGIDTTQQAASQVTLEVLGVAQWLMGKRT